jgi:LuxR family transcriptional regulator, maltose regulon positive regulatory protein
MPRSNTSQLAKISRPRLAGAIARPRLFVTLDECGVHPVIWLHAPPGAGKTTLIASYLDARKLPAIWYQLDSGDADPAAFFHYLGIAIKGAVSRMHRPLPLFTQERIPDISGFARRYFRDLYGRLKAPCAFVLDNYQEVSEASSLHTIVREALQELPDGIIAFVLSRAEPPAELARLYATRTLSRVNYETLKLTLDETRNITRLMHCEVSEAELIGLQERTDGWAAGLVLSIEHARQVGQFEISRRASQQALFHYFGSEVLQTLPQSLHNFLLASAFLPRMTADMARAISGHPNAAQILDILHRRQLFITCHGTSTCTYQYHALFRDFLLSQAQANLAPIRVTYFQRQAAQICEAHGYIEDAVELYLDALDYQAAVHLVLKASPRILLEGRQQSLHTWISRLPEDVIAANGRLLYCLARAVGIVNPASARHLVTRAYERLVHERDAVGQLQAAAWGVMTFMLEREDCTGLDQWIVALKNLLAEPLPKLSPDLEAQALSALIIALLHREPRSSSLTKVAGRLMALVEHPTPKTDFSQAAISLISYARWMGDLDLGTRLAAIIEPKMSRPMTSFNKIWWWTAHAAFRCQLLADHRTAGTHLQRANKLLREESLFYLAPTVGNYELNLALSKGDIGGAEALIVRLEQTLNPRGSIDQVHFRAFCAWLELLKDDKRAALRHAEAAVKIAELNGVVSPHAFAFIALALACGAHGSFERAAESLRNARSLIAGPYLEFNALLVEAHLALLQNATAQAQAFLREALALGRREGYRNTYIWMPELMARLCSLALQHHIEPDYVRELIRKRALRPESQEIANWPWPVKIYTLGQFTVIVDDQPIEFARKAPKKPITLLKYLIAAGGHEISIRELVDALWPHEEGDAGHRSFEVTLYRLRKILQHADVLQLQEGLLRLNASLCWVDAWAFERCASQIQSTPNLDADGLRETLRIYKGNFLTTALDEPWALPLRDRLCAHYIRLVSLLGAHFIDNNRFKDAIDWYHNGLAADDLAEEFYQGIMRCYQRMCRPAEALAVYQRMRQMLSIKVGVNPSPTSQALAQKLRAT